MVLRLEVPDFNKLFKDTVNPVIINDIPYVTEEDKKLFNLVIMTTYETDVLSNVPSCLCGDINSAYNLGAYCARCHTYVTTPAEGTLDLRTWIRAPQGMDGFIMPLVWLQLTKLLSPNGYNIMTWLTCANSKPPKHVTVATKKRIELLTRMNWPRGLNNFIRNFDAFIEILPTLVKHKGITYAKYLKSIRNHIFPKYIPMPSKPLLVLEKSQTGAFADLAITFAIDAAKSIAHLSLPRDRNFSHAQVETKTIGVINNLVRYYVTTIKSNFCAKKGWFRGHLFCSKSHWSARGVISSISVPHHYEDLWVPWAQGVELLKYHIISKLLKRGYAERPALAMVEYCSNIYNPYIAEIIQELIDQAPTGRIPAVFQRNPSLGRASAQLLYINKIKSDVSDRTISLSVLVTRGFNADFDGDEMNLTLMIDNYFHDGYKALRPHFAVYDTTELGAISGIYDLPDVCTSNIANFVNV